MRFDANGEYRFLYMDHSGQETVLYVDARDDKEAVKFAIRQQHGLAVAIWCERRLVMNLPARLWPTGAMEYDAAA